MSKKSSVKEEMKRTVQYQQRIRYASVPRSPGHEDLHQPDKNIPVEREPLQMKSMYGRIEDAPTEDEELDVEFGCKTEPPRPPPT